MTFKKLVISSEAAECLREEFNLHQSVDPTAQWLGSITPLDSDEVEVMLEEDMHDAIVNIAITAESSISESIVTMHKVFREESDDDQQT